MYLLCIIIVYTQGKVSVKNLFWWENSLLGVNHFEKRNCVIHFQLLATDAVQSHARQIFLDFLPHVLLEYGRKQKTLLSSNIKNNFYLISCSRYHDKGVLEVRTAANGVVFWWRSRTLGAFLDQLSTTWDK